MQELRDAARAWQRTPGVAVAVVSTLALGIGAATAIVAVVHGVLIAPLPYPHSDAVVRIIHNIGGIEQPYFNDRIVATYEANSAAFESVGAWAPTGEGVTVTGDGPPEEVRALTASRGFFVTLATPPLLGSWFSAQEDQPGAEDVALISFAYWQQKYGADPAVLGRSIVINSRPHRVIGVMPASFTYPGRADVFLPLRLDPADLLPLFRLNGIARMKPGVTLDDANADISRMLEIYFDTFRTNPKRAVRWVPALMPLKQDVIGDVGGTLRVVAGTIAFVLLMACANVATLLLLRADARRGEWAIRSALGAPSSQLARTMLVEHLLLAAIGGAVGLPVAAGAIRALLAFEPAGLPRLAEIAIIPETWLFVAAVSLLCGLLASVMPITWLLRGHSGAVHVNSRTTTVADGSQRAQVCLVVAQVALAIVLVVSSGLMLRSVDALQRVDPGFTNGGTVQAFNLTMPPATVPDLDRVLQQQHAIIDRVAAIPGVASVAFTTRLPMDPADRWSAALAVEDRPGAQDATPPNRQVKVVSPGSFRTLGTPLIAGRDFSWTDLHELREVAIVSENLAREVWGSAAAALGKRVRQFYGPAAPWREVIGVVADLHDDGVHETAPATVYWPARLDAKVFDGYHPRRVSFIVRTERAGTTALLDELRAAVWTVNPDLPLSDIRTLDVLRARSMSRTTFTLTLLSIAAAGALLLGMSGIYGVIAYAVAQRRREIGVRLALGARAVAIQALFVRRAAIVAAAGIALGLTGAAAFTRLMRAVLFGVTPADPATFAAAALVLGAVSMLAAYLPARRALAVDPVESLRAE
jgi:predicted permease